MAIKETTLGKVVCWDLSENASVRLPEHRDLDPQLICTPEPEIVLTELEKPGDAVLLLTEVLPETMEVVRTFRGMEDWATLPIFLAVLEREVTKETRSLTENLGIKLMKLPQDSELFWSELQKSCIQYRGNRDKTRAHLQMRKYYRVSLSVPAVCKVESRTVDISAGGVYFHTNFPYRPGEMGSIDVPALQESVGSGITFQVVRSETLREGPFQFGVRARFVGLSDKKIDRLIQAMRILEPGADESGEQHTVN